MRPRIVGSHDGEPVSPGLRPLLNDAYDEIVRQPSNLGALKGALDRMLAFLCSAQGRTAANCIEVDRFFFAHMLDGVTWEHLPESYTDVMGDIGGQLHNTFAAPEMAENFDGTPEQLLEQVRALKIDPGTA